MGDAALVLNEPAEVDKESLVNMNLNLVRIIAYQVAANLPQHIDINDLINAGTIGLLEAIDRFDWTRSVQFNTYASRRIRGAMLDELRGLDWMTRSMRDKWKTLERAHREVERRTGMPAKVEEVAEHLDISIDEVHRITSEVGTIGDVKLEDIGRGKTGDDLSILDCIKDPDAEDPSESIQLNELRDAIAGALDELPEREKMILSLYYFDDLTLMEIAKVFDITESRVCQIHKLALKHLGAKLKRTGHSISL